MLHLLVTGLVFIAGAVLLPRISPKEQFDLWFLGYAIVFGVFLFSFRLLSQVSPRALLGFALFLRVLTLGREPLYSEDWVRFAWDGYLVHQGRNPYVDSPLQHKEWEFPTTDERNFYTEQLYPKMNSQNFQSVYPPILQTLFAVPHLLVSLGFLSLGFSSFFLTYQFLFFCMEAFNLKILSSQNKIYFWLYAGNPLVFLESVSQCHPESLFVLAILLCIKSQEYFAQPDKPRGFIAGLVFSIPIFVKQSFGFVILGIFSLVSRAIRIPFLFGWGFGGFLLVLFVYQSPGTQWKSGMGLFFHSFRFHGFLEQIVFWFLSFFSKDFAFFSGLGSLFLGLFLYCIFSFLSIWKLGFSELDNTFRKPKLSNLALRKILFAGFTFLFAFSPVLHPWYLLPWIALFSGGRVFFRIVLFFSFTSMASYACYRYPSWPLVLFLIEGLGVLFLVFPSLDHIRQTASFRKR